jgi:curved DNA-binding protein CbpA
MMFVDYYALLSVRPDATGEEIHRAYRELAMRYHPDRNSAPDAAHLMTAINDAYSVLSNPLHRCKYDQQRRAATNGNVITAPVLRAAREALLRQGWSVTDDDGANLTLEKDTRRVRICFVDRLTNARLRTITRGFAGLSVVLAVEIEPPINLALQTVVIDLIYSRRHGADFPDDVYRALFAAFLMRSA